MALNDGFRVPVRPPSAKQLFESSRILDESISRHLTHGPVVYMRQQLTSAEIIAGLVEMAKQIAEDARRGEQLTPPLSNDELAFYDAVADLGSARELMGDEVLSGIARDLVVQVRKNLKPDWISREPIRANLRSTIKRLLARHGYPPEQSEDAIKLVLRQMEHFANEWSTDPTS
nr:type I restriction enzyme endonuclease domain-containing protein [Glycomyces sp. YM15]